MRVIAEPLAEKGFAPFGEELTIPASGRTFFDGALANLRRSARPSLSLVRKEELSSLPLTQWRMERHAFSSQSFVPLEAGRWLLLVAPDAGGAPDLRALRAFLAGPRQGITYFANIWHQPLSILDRSAAFAIFMWRDGGEGDEEFVTLPTPITILAQ